MGLCSLRFEVLASFSINLLLSKFSITALTDVRALLPIDNLHISHTVCQPVMVAKNDQQ